MNTSHLTPAPQLPDGYTLKQTHTHPEGWEKSYIVSEATGAILAITGEGDNQTYELSTTDRPSAWTRLALFPTYRTHAGALHWYAAVLRMGEAGTFGPTA